MSTLFPAHEFGARYDLPIPLLLFVVAGVAVAVVVVSLLPVRPRAVRADDANADVPDRVPDAGLNLPATLVSLAVLLGLGGLLGGQSAALPPQSQVTQQPATAGFGAIRSGS